MSSEQEPISIFCVKHAKESNLLVTVCKFVYWLLFILCITFVIMVVTGMFFSCVILCFCLLVIVVDFFRDISLNN